ncbi:polysaccharide biosynthesis C-terminal domain-containing protein [Natronomonas salina]|nr:polysaccharide biosynthesis C-terminal domain-containing protein [Natronomonas salina]
MSGMDNVFQRFFSIFGAKVITTITAIVSTPLIVRFLGAEDYGNYAVLLSIFSLYMIPVSSGVTEGIQKFVAEQRETENWRGGVIRFYLGFATAIGLVGVGVLLVVNALGIPRRIFGEGFTLYFNLLATMVLVTQFSSMSMRTVLGFGLEPISESLKVTKKLVLVGLGLGLVAAGFGVTGMLLGHIVSSLLVAVAAGIVVVRKVSLSAILKGTPSSFPYREVLSFNGLNIVLVTLVMSLFHVDVIMLRTLVDSETTGYYKAALQLAEYVWFVPIVLQTLLLHSTSNLWSEDRTEQITEIATRVTRYTLLLVAVMAIGLAALADSFVPLYYGDEFSVSVVPLLLLLPGTVGFAIARPLQAISQGSGQLRTLIVATAVAAGSNLVLNGLLIPLFGMRGAAAATSASYGSMFLLFVWAAWRIGYDPLADFRAPRIVATVAVSAPVIFAADHLIAGDIVSLAVVPILGGVTYLGVALATGALSYDETIDLLSKVPGPVGRVARARRS